MGLNEVYTVIRGNILMMSLLPSTAQAFSLLIQEEKQREYRPIRRTPMESISLNANAGRGSQGGRGYRTNFSSSSELSNNGNRSVLICDFCKKQGHIKERCYKLHGYPPRIILLTTEQTTHHSSIHNNSGRTIIKISEEEGLWQMHMEKNVHKKAATQMLLLHKTNMAIL